jgi:hypothetical protein
MITLLGAGTSAGREEAAGVLWTLLSHEDERQASVDIKIDVSNALDLVQLLTVGTDMGKEAAAGVIRLTSLLDLNKGPLIQVPAAILIPDQQSLRVSQQSLLPLGNLSASPQRALRLTSRLLAPCLPPGDGGGAAGGAAVRQPRGRAVAVRGRAAQPLRLPAQRVQGRTPGAEQGGGRGEAPGGHAARSGHVHAGETLLRNRRLMILLIMNSRKTQSKAADCGLLWNLNR